MYKYLIITDGNNHYFPSNSRNAKKHIKESHASKCWIYDNNGYWVSFAELNKISNKILYPKMLRDGENRKQYMEILKQFNTNVQ